MGQPNGYQVVSLNVIPTPSGTLVFSESRKQTFPTSPVRTDITSRRTGSADAVQHMRRLTWERSRPIGAQSEEDW